MTKYIFWILTFAWAVLIWSLTTTAQIIVPDNSWLQNIFMMGAHFTFFGVQALLLYVAFPHQPLSINHLPLILTSLYGLLIELVQRTVPGRSADPLDWLLDTLGALTFLHLFKKLKVKI